MPGLIAVRKDFAGVFILKAIVTIVCMPSAMVCAQSWHLDPSVGAVVTATDNVFLVPSDQARRDVEFVVSPRLGFRRSGPRLRFEGEVGVDFTKHVNVNDLDRATPILRGSLAAVVVERFLFLDMSANVSRIEADAFAARTNESSSFNRRLATSYQVSPHIDYELGTAFAFKARSDFAWTHLPGDESSGVGPLPARTLQATHHTAVLERRPQPLGVVLEFSSERSQNSDDSAALLNTQTAKLAVSYAMANDAQLGVVGGTERSRFSSLDETDSVYGVRLRWTPNLRTDLNADLERHYFGNGYHLTFTHRMPWLTTSIGATRMPVSNPFAIDLPGVRSTLAESLNAILITRYPDPTERGRIVQDLLLSRGLSPSASGAVDIAARYAQLEQRINVSFALLGPRNTFALSGYSRTLRQLNRLNDPVAAIAPLESDNRQTGVSLGINRKLSPRWSVDLAVGWTRAVGLAARAGDQTTQETVRLSVTHLLGPKTNVSIGLLGRVLDTNVGVSQTVHEISGFAGMLHHF